MAAQEVLEEPTSEPIKYKTWILKVSIHCEGCKRKVKKILQQVQGVFEIDIDPKQQKVTVIGDVDADILLRKLIKAGKHAELWPVMKVEEQEKKQGKPKNKEKTMEQEGIEEPSKPPTVKTEQVQEPSKNTQVAGAKVSKTVAAGGGAAAKTGEGSGGGAKTSGESSVAFKVMEGTVKKCTVDQVVKEAKVEEKKPDSNRGEAAEPPVEAEKKGGENDNTNSGGKVGGNDGGNSGKRKKKKGQSGNNAGGEQSSTAPASIGSQNQEDDPPTGSVPANHIPPHHPSYYASPPHFYAPPPVYSVSYNTSHPMSDTASYYDAPPSNSYVYAYNGYSGVAQREAPPPPSDLDTYTQQPLDSFEIFSDENPNGCSVM